MPAPRISALQAHWERRLSAEGLGERSLFNPHQDDGVTFVRSARLVSAEGTSAALYGRQVPWHELAQAEMWQTIETQAQSLPVPEAREFLLAYCQDGNLVAAARRAAVTRSRALWLLALANRHWKLLAARMAPGDVYGRAEERARAAG